MNTTILGSGGWGTALALLLHENGHSVTLWSYREEESQALETTRENPYLKGVTLPNTLRFTTDLSCVKDCEAVIIAVPSFAVRTTAAKLKEHLQDGTVIISVSKGIEKDTSLRLSQIIEQEIGETCPVVVLSGPSHAEEVARHVPTAVVAAADNEKDARFVQDLFMSPHFRVYTSDDKIGVEIGAAMKNVVALCAGCIDGMNYGDNTKAMLITRGLAEITRLGVALGGRRESFIGLAGVGDLYVTCSSMHSRNRRCGILIGEGMKPEDAVKEIGAVVEGYYAAANARALARQTGVEMPIAQSAYEVLYEGRDVHTVVSDLMSRAKRAEADEI